MLTDKTIGNKPGAVMTVNPENVDNIALKVLKKDTPEFLLPMNVINIDGEYELRYELIGNRFSYFNEKMVKRDYITLLKNLLLPYKLSADWFLDYHNLCLDKHYMMYNKNNYSVKYVYIPTIGMLHTDEEINKFFQNFVVNIEVTDDSTYPMKLLRILMSGNTSPIQLLEVLNEQNDNAAPAAQEVVRPAAVTASAIVGQGVEALGRFVDDSVNRIEKSKAELQQNAVALTSKTEKHTFSFFDGKGKNNTKKAEAVTETTTQSSVSAEAYTASRPGVATEFGKQEVGGDIMGNLFGETGADDKPAKSKKAEKPPKAPKQPKQPKEGGSFFGGLFGGKKADKDGQANQDLSAMMGQQVTPVQQTVQQPMYEQPRMVSPYIQQGYVPVSPDDDEAYTVVFEEDDNYMSDNMVRLQLEDAAGFQLPSLIEIDMSKGFATVGRLDKNGRGVCDYNFNPSISFVSRSHFRLEKVNDQIQIIDLNSSNGTYINGTKIVSNIPYNISRGDLIMFSMKKRVAYKML